VTLSPTARKFVLHWGEMGHAWGINRTMAQVHALLFVASEPLDSEEISQVLDVSRSNVSTSLRELIAWGVVQRVHTIGDRRDRFAALKDVLETFRVISAERKRREIDPTVELLEECLRESEGSSESDAFTRGQVQKMLEFTRMISEWYSQIERLPKGSLLRLLRGGAILAKLLPSPPAGEVELHEPHSAPSGPG
jgi:DNA-binding transcriptional regulator GbsR (MarR family)